MVDESHQQQRKREAYRRQRAVTKAKGKGVEASLLIQLLRLHSGVHVSAAAAAVPPTLPFRYSSEESQKTASLYRSLTLTSENSNNKGMSL